MIGYETPKRGSIDPAAVANVEEYDGRADASAWIDNLIPLSPLLLVG